MIDDVWTFDDLQPFLRGSPNSARLITTRITAVAAQARAVRVDEMKPAEAAELLLTAIGTGEIARSRLGHIARRLGEWPVLINLFAGHVRDCVLQGMTSTAASDHLLAVLEEIGITALDRANESGRAHAVGATIGASLKRLSEVEAGALKDLAVFPEDGEIPVTLIGEFWLTKPIVTVERLRRIANLELLRLDLGSQTVTVHDVIRRYLTEQHGNLADAHARLISQWRDRRALSHDYAWRWLGYHSIAARQVSEFRVLLFDFDWMQAKLDATDVGSLIGDYDALPEADPLRLAQDALRLGAYCLNTDKAQLASQITGRIRPVAHADLDALLEGAKRWRGRPWLRPLRPTLHAPGGPLVRVLRGYAGGHRGTIRSLAIDGIGRWAISAGNSNNDQCVMIWNVATGTHRRLEGQAEAGGYTPVAITTNGDLCVSAFRDELRVWRVAAGERVTTLPGPGSTITAVAISDCGNYIVAGAQDGSVVWCDRKSAVMKVLGAHVTAVEAIALTPDARWAVSINTVEAKRWDLDNGCETHRWPTPGFRPFNHARCLNISSDGQHAAWGGHPQATHSKHGGITFSGHHSIMVHDTVTGEEHVMVWHEDARAVLCFSDLGKRAIVARSEPFLDDLAGVLTIEKPPRFIALTDVGRGVTTAAISRNGRWGITADYEHDLFLWDFYRVVEEGRAIVGPESEWSGRAFDGFGDSGRIAVFGLDTERPVVFDIETEKIAPDDKRSAEAVEALRMKQGEAGEALTKVPGSLAVTRHKGIWKLDVQMSASGKISEGRGHAGAVLGGSVAPHGVWDATVSEDGTVRVWDRLSRRQIAVFSDETVFHNCRWSADGRTLAVTDRRGKTQLLRLEGLEPPKVQRR